jgi:hypothetical protein
MIRYMISLKVLKNKLPEVIFLLAMVTSFSGCASDTINDGKNGTTAVSQSKVEEKTTNAIVQSSALESITAVVTLKNELLMVSLKDRDKNKVLDKGGVFSLPKISPDKNYAAYLKDRGLYVATSEAQKTKVTDSVPQYSYPFAWLDEQTLLYSPSGGGLYAFDVVNKKSKPYLQNEYNYENIILDRNKNIYAEKYRYYKKDGSERREDFGIISYNPSSLEEKSIINPIPSQIASAGGLGMYPVIAGASADRKYFYFWKHPYSGSMAADGVELAAFDMSTGKLIDYGQRAPFVLTYRDNISSNPKDSDKIALINGGGREMYIGKELVLFNLQTGELEKLTPEGRADMTPNYSIDGNSIVYASSPEQKDTNLTPGQWLSSADHHIYEIDLVTKQINQITKDSAGFDFGPKYVGAKTILFFRKDKSKNISIWKTEDGKETMLADKLTFSEDENYPTESYYGHFDYTKFTDIR